ncbi:MAG: hypothetical protein WC933_00855 [Candidatus Paceibacterota bacterium]|jgi:hypothetical protein
MKSLEELQKPLMNGELYKKALSIFIELLIRPYYKKHRVEAIGKAAQSVGVDFWTFQGEMTRIRSLNALVKRIKKDEEKAKEIERLALEQILSDAKEEASSGNGLQE